MRLVSLVGAMAFYVFTIIDMIFNKGSNKFDYFTLGLVLNILLCVCKED